MTDFRTVQARIEYLRQRALFFDGMAARAATASVKLKYGNRALALLREIVTLRSRHGEQLPLFPTSPMQVGNPATYRKRRNVQTPPASSSQTGR